MGDPGEGSRPLDSPQSSHPARGLSSPCVQGCTLYGLCLTLRESHRSGRSVDRHGNGLGGSKEETGAQSLFIPRPVQPLRPSSAPGRKDLLLVLPQARHLVVSLYSVLHVPCSLPQRIREHQARLKGPPQEKGESTPKLPTLTLSRKTPVILGCPVLFLNVRSYTQVLEPPGSRWRRGSPLPTATLRAGSWWPLQSQGCGSDLALPQFQGCRHAAQSFMPGWGEEVGCWKAGRHTPPGASKAPGAWRAQESGACPRKLSGSGNLMDGSGVSLNPHIQEPPQRGAVLLAAGGSRPG